MKYKAKLEETIKNKEDLVKGVNQAKSRAVNQQKCSKLLTQINDKNYEHLID